MNKSYVHNGKEVVLTGRMAKRKPRREGERINDDFTQYEIRPVNVDADNNNFNEWVRMRDLLEVV